MGKKYPLAPVSVSSLSAVSGWETSGLSVWNGECVESPQSVAMRASNDNTGWGRQAAARAFGAVRLLALARLPAWCVADSATATQTLSTRFFLIGKRWVRLVVFTLGAVLAFPGYGVCQVITNTSDTTLAASLVFGSLTPAKSTTTTGTSVQFLLRDSSSTGYHVNAQLTSFTVTPTALADGGATIASSDIGVGIISMVAGSSVLTPRTDTIAAGFNYNPATMSSPSGLTPYLGAASGSARLSDLAASRTILSGPKIANSQATGSNKNALTVTMAFGAMPQYFTPASFSAVLTLTISNGP